MQPYTLALLALFYYTVTATVVLLPNSLGFRAFLLPITLYRAFGALKSFDVVESFGEGSLNYLNYLFGVIMMIICLRVLDWTFCGEEPLQRPKSSKTDSSGGIRLFLKDVFDLCINHRGIGWAWSRNYTPPSHTRPTSSTALFLLYTFVSSIIHYIIGDLAHFLIQSSDWTSFTNPRGAPLFNPRLSPIPRYTLSTFNSAMVAIIAYCGIQTSYDTVTIIAIVFFGYSPVDWPPIFNEPWKSTSVVDFWANRWHQLFRAPFINLGNRPLAYIFGRKSGVSLFGGFLISSVLHSLGMWKMGGKIDFVLVVGFFISQGVGVFIELVVLGGKVGGWKGWIWTVLWVGLWSNMLTHVWFLHGLAASNFLPQAYRPSLITLDFVQKHVKDIIWL